MLYLTFMNSLAYISPALFLFTIHVAMIVITQDGLFWLNSNVLRIFSGQFLNGFVYTVDFAYALTFTGFIFYSLFLKNRH